MSSSKGSRHYTSGMMAGVPVITGTRVPLQTLAEYLKDGRGIEVFLGDHPHVTVAQVNRALAAGLQALIDRREALLTLGTGKAGGGRKPPASGRSGSEGE